MFLQFIKPVQGDVDLLGWSFAGIGGSGQWHDEVFATVSDIKAVTGLVRHDSFDWERRGLANDEIRLRLDIH